MNENVQVLYHALIYTMNEHYPRASAMAIHNGHVLALGTAQQILTEFGEGAKFFDLSGKTILPGLTDAHFHLMHYALSLQKVVCETATRQACLDNVAERARQVEPGEWILGHGWNQNGWPEGFGSASDLDACAPRNPVYLTAKSLHAGWANSLALRQAGLTASSPDPDGGRLGRDDSGNLDGILYESAMRLLECAIPEPGDEDLVEAIRQALPTLWRVGLTGLHDFDGPRCFAALQTLQARDQLKLRVTKSIPLGELDHAIALGLRTGFGNDYLRIGSVKAFADGALGPQTAAMLQSYETDLSNLGILMLDGEEFFEHGRKAVDHGLSMAVHAIGDRANHEMLQAYSQLREYERQHQLDAHGRLRHRIEHVQLLHPDDLDRLGALDIIASMQPIHATSDMTMADEHWGKRSEFAYAWRSQLDHGARLAFGSDAPVESPNPFWGLHAAVTRQRQSGEPGPQGWYPAQRLNLHEAMAGFTTGAAFAAGTENFTGRLSPGFAADLIVLDNDPFAGSPEEIARIAPVQTMLAGEWIYSQ